MLATISIKGRYDSIVTTLNQLEKEWAEVRGDEFSYFNNATGIIDIESCTWYDPAKPISDQKPEFGYMLMLALSDRQIEWLRGKGYEVNV
jgi:hypothetical protein